MICPVCQEELEASVNGCERDVDRQYIDFMCKNEHNFVAKITTYELYRVTQHELLIPADEEE